VPGASDRTGGGTGDHRASGGPDRLEILDLAYRYASGADRRDPALFVSAFSPGGTLRVARTGPDGEEVVSTRTGHEELGRVPGMLERYDRTFHFVGNHRCDIQGDEATGEVYCTARHLTRAATGDTDFVMLIRYLDRYRREPDGPWLIDDRLVQVDWSELHTVVER
jgi:SnoaL-like domain